MADRVHIPNSPACGQWETLLADALDGLLQPEDEATFTSHMAICPACTALFEEARRGREWLEFLSSEPDVPEGLLDKILAATGPGQVAGYGLVTGGGNVVVMPPAWQRPGFIGPRPAFCRATAADDRGDGILLNRIDAESDRGSPQRSAALQSATERCALFHGASPDDGLDPDHSLLRPFAPGLRSRITDAGAAPHNTGRKHRRSTAAEQRPTGKPGGVEKSSQP